MAINVKKPEAEQLARELAARTGESLTEAVLVALRERAERLRLADAGHGSQDRTEQILAVGRDIAPLLQEPWVSRDHGDLLYDEDGLPA